MMTIFKTFNTKTKEVKEYSKPEFGDFGEFVIVRDKILEYLGESLAECQLHKDNQCYRQDNRELKYNELIGGDNITAIRFFKNTDRELNTLFNGLFKNCVYSNGDWVGVLQKTMNYQNHTYKVGEVYGGNIFTYTNVQFTNDAPFFGCETEGFAFVDYNDHFHDYVFRGFSRVKHIGKDNSCLDITSKDYQGNLLEEYFAGGDKLVNIFNL